MSEKAELSAAQEAILDDVMGRFQPRTPDFLRLPLLQHLFVLVHAPHLPQVDASTWTDVQSLARLIARRLDTMDGRPDIESVWLQARHRAAEGPFPPALSAAILRPSC